MEKFNLRHLRAFRQVARCGGVSAASDKIFLSQPAITQALAKLEISLGTSLFVRKSTGMFLTEAGTIFYGRVDRSLEMLAVGAKRGGRAAVKGRSAGFQNFDQLLTTAQLRSFLALCDAGNYSWAARNLGISRPSVHRSINDIERIAGFTMFIKTAHGFELTQSGEVFRRSVMLAFEELRQGLEEIDFLLGQDTARIVVGSLPLARSFILPQVINEITKHRPEVSIIVRDGSYTDLLHALRYGEIDILIGALRSPVQADDVEQEALFTDKLAIAARAGHPLAGKEKLDAKTLAQFPWVTPSPTIPTREQFDALFGAADVNVPTQLVETSSLILIRGLLVGSDRLTIISRHQIAKELEDGILVELDVSLAGFERKIGIAKRLDWAPTKTQKRFVEMLHSVCSDLQANDRSVR